MGYHSAEIPYNTQHLDYKGKKICAYCGKELKQDESWDDGYPDETFYHCDCEDAKKEIELQQKKYKLEYELSSVESGLRDIRSKTKYFIHKYKLYKEDENI